MGAGLAEFGVLWLGSAQGGFPASLHGLPAWPRWVFQALAFLGESVLPIPPPSRLSLLMSEVRELEDAEGEL